MSANPNTSMESPRHSAQNCKRQRVLMLVENAGYPDDTRIAMESRCLRDAGHQVVVIAPTGNSKRLHEIVDGVIVYRYPQFWELRGFAGYVLEYAYSLALAFAISLYVAVRHGFDVVHSRIPPDVYVLIGGFYKLFGKRFVADLQDSSPDLYAAQHDGTANKRVIAALRWWERRACRSADCLITINETYRRMLSVRAGIPIERCHVVRNAPDAGFLKPVEPLESLRRDGRLIIGYMGIIGVQDRVDVLLETLFCLKNEIGCSKFLAVIVGSGPALDEVKNLATSLELDNHVQFVGFQVGDDLLRHVASFDICVTPDPSNPYNDGCSFLKMMEYMAMGKPVVAFDLQENRVTAGDAALFATGNSVRELAQLIERLIADPAERVRLGELGRQRVLDHWVWEKQQAALIDAYETLDAARDRVEERARSTQLDLQPTT